MAPDTSADPSRPLTALVSFRYLRAAVQRRWLRCSLLTFLGLVTAGAYLVLNPIRPAATTMLMLAHDSRADPSSAMDTDISLLTIREVAERTIAALDLPVTSEVLLASVTPSITDSSQIIQLTMTAPTDADAVRRLGTFSSEYLNFRAKQVSAQSDILIKGYQDRISDLRSSVRKLNSRILTPAGTASTTTDGLNDAVTERSKLNDQISTLQDEVQQAILQRDSIVLASRVIDPPVPVHSGSRRHVAVVLASGLIGGAALGFGLVVLQAILSDRLWLRVEVASALKAPVLLSVRRLAPFPRPMAFVRLLPGLRTLDIRRWVDRQRTAHVIGRLMPEADPRSSLAVVCLGNARDMRYGLATACLALGLSGRTATIVDLTGSAGVASAVGRLIGDSNEGRPEVLRPSVVPSRNRRPPRLDVLDWDDAALAEVRDGTILVIVDFDPALGVDHLTRWTDRVLIAVTAGKSSVELVRTSCDLVRSAGLRLDGAVLLRATRDDNSSGVATARIVSPRTSPAAASGTDDGPKPSLLS